jgi:hypothetical protein
MGRSRPTDEDIDLEPIRSKSLSAIPDEPATLNLDTQLQVVTSSEEKNNVGQAIRTVDEKTDGPEWDREVLDGEWARNALMQADTAHSLIDRHDMYKDVGRIETKDIRDKSKEAAGV